MILDIFEHWENSNQDGLLLFLDFEKAFDSVEWNFLFQTLETFNFGTNFIKWIKILYTKPIFRLKNNGWISRTCQMHRGIRQGCPISAILYLFVAEILSDKIKSNKSIHGFTNKNLENEIKNIQHADDMTLAVRDTDSLTHAVKTINEFCELAGSKINFTKTECMLFGNLKNKFESIGGIKVTKKAVKCLGIYIGQDRIECYNKNWMKIYHEIDLLFESWKRRKLSLFGKCTIINALALSKMTYVASILELPDPKYIKDINKLIFKFLWNKQDRIKRNTLIGDIKDGGIGIVDMESKLRALKATWIPRLVTSNHILKKYVGSFCKPLNIDIDYLIKTSETSIDDYGILKKSQCFTSRYSPVSTYVRITQTKLLIPLKNSSHNQYGLIGFSFFKVNLYVLMIG